MGGIGFPHSMYYYAAQLTRVIDWCMHKAQKIWISVEQNYPSIPLEMVPWELKKLPVMKHPVIGTTLKIVKSYINSKNHKKRLLSNDINCSPS